VLPASPKLPLSRAPTKDALAFRFRGLAYADRKDFRNARLDEAAALNLNPALH
jgi:hypothetical protein